MTFKEFGEEAEVQVIVKILVNDQVALSGTSFDIDGAIDLLGKAERANTIYTELEKQYQDLPEPIEDESRGYND